MNLKSLGNLNQKKVTKLVLVPIAVVVALLLYRFKGYFVAASVNGQPISRVAVLTQLEKEGGKQILDNLVTNTLVLQEAKKEKVTVTNDEIKAQEDQITNNLKAQGQELDTALAAQGMTKQDLDEQIRLQILVQKMAGKDVVVSDQEIEDYFKANTASYPKGTKLADVKQAISDTLKGQKTNDAITSWVSNLRTKAKINYYVNY